MSLSAASNRLKTSTATFTFLHHVEHVADIPGRRVARFKVPMSENGARVWRDMAEFDTSGAGVHANWPDRFFARIVDAHLAESGNRGGLIGDAASHLISARALLAYALPVMKAIAADCHPEQNEGSAACP